MSTRLFLIEFIIRVGIVAFSVSMVQATDRIGVDDHIWLESDLVKVGLKRSSGGAVFWISPAGAKESLINSFDRGRLIQQSWYGKPDGSLWNNQPWRWNPVQGGDWRGKSATVLEERVDSKSICVKTQPVHWATGEELTDCVMEQTVTLDGPLIHIHYRFMYSGNEKHQEQHQELPAFFVEPNYDTLVLYDGDRPWTDGTLARSQPGFPNEYKKITEHWAAYVDQNDFGIGCFVPSANDLTCYRFCTGSESPARCSYFAPIRTMAVTPRFASDYDVWITMGRVEEIRNRFLMLARERSESK